MGHNPITVAPAALGARVIAAAGSQAKLDIAVRYGGADHVVNYSKPGWQKEVLKLTNGKGVDIIYDPVGLINGMCNGHLILNKPISTTSIDSLKCIAWKGRALVIGFAAGNIEKVTIPLGVFSGFLELLRSRSP